MRISLPFIRKQNPFGYSTREWSFILGWFEALGNDKALRMQHSTPLFRCARDHADYLEYRNAEQRTIYAHIGRDKKWANERARLFGYKLPSFWPDDQNGIESVAWSDEPVGEFSALSALLNSPPHREHILCNGGFASQTTFGVGNVGQSWVILTAPKEE
jgi:hypothetical protein